MTQGGGQKREIVGRHRPQGKIQHLEGFHQALEDALANHDWPQGKHEADVHFAAVVEITNPGVINEYLVRLSTPG
jgi:hypothetical protein